MKISCIIPTYNSAQTIGILLQSIGECELGPDEIIIVDDNSSDKTIEVIQVYNNVNLVINNRNLGPAASRNIGMAKAQGDIIVFLDSDISLNKDFFKRVLFFFKQNPKNHILSGIYSDHLSIENFSTRYKTFYMNYIQQKNLNDIDFVLGACCAIVRGDKRNWNEQMRFAEDTYWGHEHVYVGKKRIALDQNIQVDHHKQYRLTKLMINDFWVASGFVTPFLDFLTRRNEIPFSHVSLEQISGLFFALLLALSVIFGTFMTSVSAFICWLFSNYKMLIYLNSKMPKNNIIFIIGWTLIDHYIYLSGIIVGLVQYLTLSGYENRKAKRTQAK